MDSPYNSLIINLLIKSRDKRVHWQTTSDPRMFLVTSGKQSISITNGYDEMGEEEYFVLSIRNEKGTIIDSFVADKRKSEWDQLNELYYLARRYANNVDETIDKLLNDLKSEGNFGDPF